MDENEEPLKDYGSFTNAPHVDTDDIEGKVILLSVHLESHEQFINYISLIINIIQK